MSTFTFTAKSGDTITIPAIKSLPAGSLRRHRSKDWLDMMFSLLEEVTDVESLAAFDLLPLHEVDRLFKEWEAAEVSLPES